MSFIVFWLLLFLMKISYDLYCCSFVCNTRYFLFNLFQDCLFIFSFMQYSYYVYKFSVYYIFLLKVFWASWVCKFSILPNLGIFLPFFILVCFCPILFLLDFKWVMMLCLLSKGLSFNPEDIILNHRLCCPHSCDIIFLGFQLKVCGT